MLKKFLGSAVVVAVSIRSSLFTPRSSLLTLRSSLFTLHHSLFTPRSSLFTLHRLCSFAFAVTLYSSLFTLYYLYSATPSKVEYHGYMKYKNSLFSGTRTMKFRITNSDGSVAYWDSGNVTVTVSQGEFSYNLEPTNIDWGAKQYYVEVTVEGIVMSPREDIKSSIYALHAKNIDDGVVTSVKTNIISISTSTGKIPALTSAYFESIDGSALTNLQGGIGATDGACRASTGTIQAQLNAVAISTGTLLVKSSAEATYLFKNETATDSMKLAGYNYSYYLTTNTAVGTGDMLKSVYDIGGNEIVDNSEKLAGYSYGYFATTVTAYNLAQATGTLDSNKLDKSSATATYLFKNEKSTDTDKLNGYGYLHFVDTCTVQVIEGNKIFTPSITFSSATFSGNVGIGTTNPGANLEVKGTVRMFGAWSLLSADTVYQASTDGFIVSWGLGSSFRIKTDSSNPPTTIVTASEAKLLDANMTSATVPVRKGDYWKVETAGGAAPTVRWIPIGI